ncbi:MAG: RagB/SusD family nutrient uptake outer membrane protein [Lunatimonas sp.]|uniref:RagB/SusD family nutrient uptake outer membrane protein n=1 Tax=Lunatimonas sp. TaxID=2060141 RepID=UPI00263A5BE0|nr:RagB/SusD family nutrient uptake outer membrane protein [Lunatimonas sp.]MCC5938368.1 RagB/SusD family nutrient uptake outer membrane protein [Lunatimonas sp.]
MKNIKLALSGFLLAAGLSSCDEFIEKQPIDQLSQATFFADEATTRTAIIGTYRSMTSSASYGQAFIVIPEFAAGNMAHISSFPEYVEYQNFNIRIDNPWSLNIWTASYNTINAANNIIAFAPRIDGFSNNTTLQNLVREARFIRALSYFNLVRGWGDVPLILEPTTQQTTSADLRVSRNAASDVYAAIIADLTQALDLPLNASGTAKGRASGMAARALLAKVQLYTGNFAQAAQLAEEVLGNGSYGLVENFANIWATENSSESLFELQFDQQTPNTFVTNANPASRQEFFARASAEDLFDETDLRKSFTVRRALDVAGNEQFYVGKYRNFNPPNQNVPVLRLGEVYLIHAEARAKADGNVSEAALSSLNAIRQRAGISPIANPGSVEAFTREVQLEKRREMMFEFETWFDLTRTGLATELLGVPSQQRFVFPIPQLELDLNRNLVQNPGY